MQDMTSPDRVAALADADIVLRLRPPSEAEAAAARAGSLHIGYLEPFGNRAVLEAFGFWRCAKVFF